MSHSRPAVRMRYCTAPRCSTTVSGSAAGRSAGAAALKPSVLYSPGASAVSPCSVSAGASAARVQLTGPRNVASSSAIEVRLDAHVSGDRVGDEALLVGAVMQLRLLVAPGQPLAGEAHARPQRDAHHGGLAGGVRPHHAARVVGVFIDTPAAGGRQRQ